jgi:predicted lipid-binding transport protein (Tim44 family)
MSKIRIAVAALGVASALAIVAADYADARAGRGGSIGSRGSRTFDAPPATNTAPKQAAPMEKSITQPGKATSAQGAQGPQSAAPASQASRFGGMRGLLMGGLIAAGLASIFGVGALASVLGFLLQFMLIAGIVWLAIAFFRSRSQPALARGPSARDSMMRDAGQGSSSVPPVGRASAAAAAATTSGAAALAIGQDDLNTFEKRLSDIQRAYSEENINKLGELTTPEMLSYFAQDLSDNAKEGVRNEITDVKLLQGDIAEAWQEGGSDYATVAMRYSLVDAIVNKITGKIVSGDPTHPTEVTEVWTFRRDGRNSRDGWQLSAIQQA